MADKIHITSKIKAWIGREKTEGPIGPVTKKEILRFCLAVDDQNPLFRHEELAEKGPYKGIIAPPLFHRSVHTKEEILKDIEPSGLGKKMGLHIEMPLPGFSGAIAGGVDIEYGEPIRPGDYITVKERVVDIYEKYGKLGPMIFIVIDRTYLNQKGEIVVREKGITIRHR